MKQGAGFGRVAGVTVKLEVLEEDVHKVPEDECAGKHEAAAHEWLAIGKELEAGSHDVRACMIVARRKLKEVNGEQCQGVDIKIETTCEFDVWWEMLGMYLATNPDALMKVMEAAGGIAIKVPRQSAPPAPIAPLPGGYQA